MTRFPEALRWTCAALAALVVACPARPAEVVIQEIMFHPTQPGFGPEPVAEEYLELVNRGNQPVNLRGWRLDRGVEFAFPDLTLAADACLVVAANRTAFAAAHPATTNVVGDWAGTLANNGEQIRLVDEAGVTVNSVHYATAGDWATRRRGTLDHNHRGWTWHAPADGQGCSLQLRHPSLDNSHGGNWIATNPTPGAIHPALAGTVGPLILDLAHSPAIPRSTQTVAVTARLLPNPPEPSRSVLATLFYRPDSTNPPPFSATPMIDDGEHGDGAGGDGIFGALVPAQRHNTVVEYYVEVVDDRQVTNRWPARPLPAPDETVLAARLPCALYQVDDSTYAGLQPLYKLILIESERAELAGIPLPDPYIDRWSNAEMNGTFISVEGTGVECRHLCGFRNRGHGSRDANPPNYRVNFPNDRPWKGQRALNLNSERSYMQVFGATLARQAGVAGYRSRAVQVRVNNVNLAVPSAGMYGSYAANEVYNSDWAERHLPFDGRGNLYRAVRDLPPSDFVWRGEAPSAYTNTYAKASHASENDWSDLIRLHRILGADDQFTTASAREVVHVEQWMRHLAVMSLCADNGTVLNTGYNDDYALYRGEQDPRFILLYRDLGAILGVLDADLGSTTNQSIFSSTAPNGAGSMVHRFLHWPDFEPLYYATLQQLLDTTFSETAFNALVDQTFASYPQTSLLTSALGLLKNWMNARRACVQAAIAGHVPPPTNHPVATVRGEPRSPTPRTGATLTVGGQDITHYCYRLNQGAWSAERSVATPIALGNLPSPSTNTVFVVGRNAAGIYQARTNATVSRTWVVDTNMLSVRLNEILARNDTAVNRHGTYPDLIELYNEGPAPVNLTGLRLTDDPAEPDRFTFPEDLILAAGEYLVVVAGKPDGAPGVHLGFALSQDGDAVYLFDRATNGHVVLDAAVFGLQLADRSIGRLDESGEWLLTQPTLGASNRLQALGRPTRLRLNEWLASGTAPFAADFLELFNPDPLPVALGGLFLSDAPIGAPARHPIAPLSFIEGLGHAVFIADGDPAAGANHLNFRLSAEWGDLSLKASDLAPIDAATYGSQRAGVSHGRCPDGATKITDLSLPTPGYANFCPGPPPLPLVNFVPVHGLWRYQETGVEPATNWFASDYDDAAWPLGAGLLGRLRSAPSAYVPEPIRTPLATGSAVTYYFRTHFTVAPDAAFGSLQLSNVVDDGAVFYVNGTPLTNRFNMPAGPVDASTRASASVTDAAWRGPIPVPTNLVRVGDNLLAVEVHQISAGSEDVMFGLRLDGVQAVSPPYGSGVVLNEVLAQNATVTEADGATPDWIEIFNASTNTADLGDMSLSDSTREPRRWVFPSPTLLPPAGFLVVRCDSEAPASATNTGFGLKAAGDAVYLFSPPAFGSNLVDSVSFGMQTPDFSLGRVPDGGSNWVLAVPSGGLSNVPVALGDPARLKVNEWMALPGSGDDWFEIYNPQPQPVALGGLWLSDDLASAASRMKFPIPDRSFLGSVTNAYQRFLADKNPGAGADHVDFKLNGTDGDAVGLSAPDGTLIDGVSFGPQASDVSEGRLPDGDVVAVAFAGSASPGEANHRWLTNVVISEVLAHSALPLEDAIEVQNLTDTPLDLGGWYLSDAKLNLRKFCIPSGTVLPAGGFRVFYEGQFRDLDHPSTAFALSSAHGDQVYLSETTNGRLSGWRVQARFGPSENGVSFGRHPTSVGADFTAMSALSFGTAVTAHSPTNQLAVFRTGQGAPNPYPQVGPVVVSEIMYHPPDLVLGGVTNDNLVEEFIELRNLVASPVPLYDPAHPTNGWRLRDAVDFRFNATHTLPPGGHLLVVSFDPATDLAALAAFRACYGSNGALAGPYTGKLDNGGEAIELLKPDAPESDGAVPYILVDKVVYQDDPPWPTNADGHGASLQRLSDTGYGNDPTNWLAASPAPGPPGLPDRDGDGLPDEWETHYVLNPDDPTDAGQDADGDGRTNLEEYLSGTDPREADSCLRVECATLAEGQVLIQFLAQAGRTYRVLYRDAVADGPWQTLAEVRAQTETRLVTLYDASVSGGGQRFYRLVTPAKAPGSE